MHVFLLPSLLATIGQNIPQKRKLIFWQNQKLYNLSPMLNQRMSSQL